MRTFFDGRVEWLKSGNIEQLILMEKFPLQEKNENLISDSIKNFHLQIIHDCAYTH